MLTTRDKAQIFLKNSQFQVAYPDWLYRLFWQSGNPFVGGFYKHKAIFIHIPKVAGTSIANALFGESVGHRPLRRHVAFCPELVEEYFKFTFVRNPYDRLFSAYNYFSSHVGSRKHRDHRWASDYLSKFDSFERFVRELEDPCVNR